MSSKKRASTKKFPGQIARRIRDLDLVCSGTLMQRRICCGKKQCRCATDPEARHGPYWQWTFLRNGRYVHKFISEDQAKLVKKGLAAKKKLLAILGQWSQTSVDVILDKWCFFELLKRLIEDAYFPGEVRKRWHEVLRKKAPNCLSDVRKVSLVTNFRPIQAW